MVVVGMDVPSHLLNALKIAQSGCSWSDTLLLYNHIHFIHHHLQFHYPPLAYLSSHLACAIGIDIRLAVALANIVWLFLGYMSIAAAAATAAENRLASLCAALIAGMVLMSPIVSPPREDAPNPVGFTLKAMRDEVAMAVEDLRASGDANVHYVNGLDILGPDHAHLLPDDVHPNAEGY
ncbi:MAG TPA: hypothetical protein ENF73_01330, partial [Proteobacteria bacterium]|nr:hypothetical protein [Pseudomonadota bacterium]